MELVLGQKIAEYSLLRKAGVEGSHVDCLRRRRRRLADLLPVGSSAIVAAGPTPGPSLPTRRPADPRIRGAHMSTQQGLDKQQDAEEEGSDDD